MIFLLFLSMILLLTPGLTGQQLNLSRTAATSVSRGAARPALIQHYANGSASLNLRGDFSGAGSPQRAIWDIPLRLDLSQTSAVKLRFRISDTSVIRQYNLYVNTGSSWYAAEFQPSADGSWEEIILPKSRFIPEGSPQSWQSCSTLRIAAWKGSSRPFQIQIAHLEMLRPNLSMGLLRGGNNPREIKDSYLYSRILGDALARRGLYPAVFESGDSTARILYPYTLLLLPYPASLTPGQLHAVTSYLRSGRHIGTFYSLPPLLASAFGQPVGKFMRGSSLPHPLAGIRPVKHLLPEAGYFRQNSQALITVIPTGGTRVLGWWYNSRQQNTNIPAILQGPRGFWMTHVYLDQDAQPGSDTLLSLIELYLPSAAQTSAAALLNTLRFNLANAHRPRQDLRLQLYQAEKKYQDRRYYQSSRLSLACISSLKQGPVIQEQKAAPNEFRGAWMRSTAGLSGQGWQQTARILKKHGINAVFPNFASCYSCSYNSSILPGNQNIDRVRECIRACRQQNIRVHFWLSCFGAGDAPASWRQMMLRQGRLAVDSQGNPLPWLCPNQYGNRQLLGNIIQEILYKYPLDGLHLDLIRYPGSTSCFCRACRNNFQEYLRTDRLRWPEDVLPGGPHHRAWLNFRMNVIRSFVAQTHSTCRKIRPGLFLSAAVYPDLSQCGSSVGQDWGQWLFRQDVDFICPMNYAGNTHAFQNYLNRQARYRNRLVPGIGATPNRLSPEAIRQQILAARQAGTPGFILFELTPNLILPNIQQ